MNTSNMQYLEIADSNKILDFLTQNKKLTQMASDLEQRLEKAFLSRQIKEVVENNYDLGKVTEVYEIFGGYVNRSFGVYTEKDGKKYEYFIRKYKKGIEEKEIKLEHKIIMNAKKKGLNIAAGLKEACNGSTFVKITEDSGENTFDWYFAVYEYLEGEDKYTWVENELTAEEYASAAEVLAVFHNAVKDFNPQGLERVEPKILELLPMIPGIFNEWAQTDINNSFHKYYVKTLPQIIESNNKIIIPSEDQEKMPLNPIHCDYHPGNLKYVDNKVVGIFDFDWSKIDLRIFEIGLGLVYFCSSWVGELDGVLDLESCRTFLEAYQRKLKELRGLSMLNETEKQYLPEMLNAGNIYLIYWCLRSYYDDLTLNVYEYLAYLQHQVKCMNWVDNHRNEILEMVKGI